MLINNKYHTEASKLGGVAYAPVPALYGLREAMHVLLYVKRIPPFLMSPSSVEPVRSLRDIVA